MNYKFLGATILVTLVLMGACDGESTEKSKDVTTEKTAKKVEKDKSKDETQVGLINDTAVLNDIDVKVLETEFISKGTYENQEKEQLGIIYEVKNKSDKEIDPISGWLAVFEATQDSKDTIRKLEVGMLPQTNKYKPFLDTQMDSIKKSGKLKNGIAYNLEDDTTPVILKATKGIGGEKLGEIEVKIEE
ncbi:DUF5067 domain-containing protein [Macrococcus animalis]|uniref:DUF5067 domain-containing protein n=1 Tax=Macrococcus animalis TaxID=3395467 RepID=UPI0039BE799E